MRVAYGFHNPSINENIDALVNENGVLHGALLFPIDGCMLMMSFIDQDETRRRRVFLAIDYLEYIP